MADRIEAEKWENQCREMSPIPTFYKESIQYGSCMLRIGHPGPHRTSVAYGKVEWGGAELEKGNG